MEQVMYMYITRHTAMCSDLVQQVPKCILALIVKRLIELMCMVLATYSVKKRDTCHSHAVYLSDVIDYTIQN